MADINVLAQGLELNSNQLAILSNNLAAFKTEQLLELDSDVSRAREGARLTKNGLDLLAKAVAGKELRFTRVSFGDSIKNGNILEPTDEQILNYTKLIREKPMNLPLTDVRFSGNGTAVVSFSVDNSDLETGFWARELGLWARDPDSGKEVLYAYKNTGALSSYIPGGGGAVSLKLIINVVTVVDQATNVTAVLDANLVYVSQAEFVNHINAATPHPNIPNPAPELTETPYIWTTGVDTQLHPISPANLAKLLLGDDLRTLSVLNSRVSQNEINIANLFMQLDSEKDLGLEANLLLAEDFADCNNVDQLQLKVDDQVAGSDTICLSDVSGVLEGCYYTLVDPNHSQFIRVKSIAKNGSLYVIFLDGVITGTYNLEKTYLYRSTGVKVSGNYAGAGDERSSFFKFADSWKGESADSSVTLDLVTTLANKKNFTCEGDFAFDSDGFFTLAS